MRTCEWCMMLDLGVLRGAECLGTNVVFVNTSQDVIFISVFSPFSFQFSLDISLWLNIVAAPFTCSRNAWRQTFVLLCCIEVLIVLSRHAMQAVQS